MSGMEAVLIPMMSQIGQQMQQGVAEPPPGAPTQALPMPQQPQQPMPQMGQQPGQDQMQMLMALLQQMGQGGGGF